jgi:large subunit ribosomal protein L21
MYAVVKLGGKQYRITNGDRITVEKLDGQIGDKLNLETLMVGSEIGTGTVTAEIIAHKRGDKVLIFKKKRRKNYRRKNGHRQDLTAVKITSVSA